MINSQKKGRNRTAVYRKTSGSILRRMKSWLYILRYILTVAALFVCVLIWKNMRMKIFVESYPFTESSRELRNPYRGFYSLYRFWISEDETDCQQLVKEKYYKDKDTEITLVQICLQAYREGAIGEKGLANIEKLFCELEALDKQLIIRFTYDAEGQNVLVEPESLNIITLHMQQLEPILRKYGKKIFIVQGLFTGNWGEMNGTRYNSSADLQRLAGQLEAVTSSSTYLAVRTPAQWRSIMESEPLKEALGGRLGLFNDGMLGNETDFGTYRPEELLEPDPLLRQSKEEELDFQNELLRAVPNGGEVINNNPYNDFENAVSGLAVRRVTYLNQDYDLAVMSKWKEAVWNGEDCFQGMDGYSYIERHLGYRLLITEASLEENAEKNGIDVGVTLKNVGFAPIYKKPKIKLILYSEKEGQSPPIEMKCDTQKLTGGEEAELTETAETKIALGELQREEYEVYFYMEDPDTGKEIQLANEEEEEEYGYHIGTISLQ